MGGGSGSGSEREQSGATVEELILEGLRRIESKVDEGFSEQGRRITALEITSGQHALQLARFEGYGGRLVPWLMLGWNVLVTTVGAAIWLSHPR